MARVLTALVLVPLSLGAIFSGIPLAFNAVVTFMAVMCFIEYREIAAVYTGTRFGLWSFAAGIALLFVPGEGGLTFMLAALAALAAELSTDSLDRYLPRAAVLVLGLAWIFGPWRTASGLQAVSPHWLVYALAINWVGDCAAFYVGRAIGKHKLAPRISPGKTWEGAIASLIGAVAFGYFYLGRFQPETTLVNVIVLSIVVNAAGQIGDLVESAFKRGAGVKDSGTLLPGHGGFLDRLDSTLFTMPVVLAYLQNFTPAK